MKKLLLLLLLSVLTVGSGKDIYATSTGGGGASFDTTTYSCNCKGEPYDYYDLTSRPYYFQSLDHVIDDDGKVIKDIYVAYGRTFGDECYYVRTYQTKSSGTYFFQIIQIYVSNDEMITRYTSDNGDSSEKAYDSWSTSGITNGKYWAVESSSVNYYSSTYTSHELVYSDSYHYEIELSASEDLKTRMEELAIFLCGGTSDLPVGFTPVTPLPIYDLEPPLDIKVTTADMELFAEIPYKIWWNQSNIDLSGYKTSFYVKGYGQYKPSVFSAYKDIETSWLFEESVTTAKYCNNNLKFFDYSYEDMQIDLRTIAESVENDSVYQVKNNSVDFMIRNEKKDENGQMHYSNWVYVNTYEDGTYSVYEMNKDYNLDEDSDETGQINTDSTIYDDEVIYEDSDETLDVGGVSNVGSFIKVMKDLANSLKTFPEFFAKMFSFLPSWVLTCIGILFIIILICAIF